jgi:ribosomal protein L11 methyltransferase
LNAAFFIYSCFHVYDIRRKKSAEKNCLIFDFSYNRIFERTTASAMKWMEVRIIFDGPDPDTAMDLISGIFVDLGRPGVIQEGLQPEPDTDWADDAPPLPRRCAVIGHLPENDQLAAAVTAINRQLAVLETTCRVTSEIKLRSMDEEDWAESWKSHFHPFRIGDHIIVKPSWHDYHPLPGDLILEIDPGMAFGTGTHATTSMCIRLLERHLRPGDRVLDIGCGSGILMLAAEKLGASHITGVDTDPVAVSVAAENMIRNRITPDKFQVFSGNLTTGVDGRFEVVCANIRTHVIHHLMGVIRDVLTPGGLLICSGITRRGREEILAEMHFQGLALIDELTDAEWVAMAAGTPASDAAAV